MFGPDPTTKKAGSDKKKKVKKNPNEGGFGDEPNEIKFNPEYRSMMDRILGRNSNSEYYKKIRPQD